jgi:hypothetical protein
VTINDGNDGRNYSVKYQAREGNTINAAPLKVTVNDVTKPYDGTDSAAASLTVEGTIFKDDNLFNGIVRFADRNAGDNKQLDIGFLGVSDSNGGKNYSVTYVPSKNSQITRAPLTVSTVNGPRPMTARLMPPALPPRLSRAGCMPATA